MPTGYTSDLYGGEKKITFRKFALSCARAFGALIEMRDEAHDAPIPDEFKPGDYNEKALKKAQEELEEIRSWTVTEAAVQSERAHKEAVKAWKKSKERCDAIRARYEEMLAHVEAWEPPTAAHMELKNFMASQIRESIKFDCSNYDRPKAAAGGLGYRAERLKSANWSVNYHSEEHRKEVERCRERTEWVRALKKSL